MLIAIVQIPLPGQKSKDQAIMGGMKTTDQYLGMPGLIRKDYLSSDEGGGGVYLWESREAAEAWYNDCLLYTSPSPRDATLSRMPSSA